MTDRPLNDPHPLAVAPPGAERHVDAAFPGDPREVGDAVPRDAAALSSESGLEIKARSQWAYARRRFMRHRLALGSLIVLLFIFGCGVFANAIAPYTYQEINLESLSQAPSEKHIFGTDSAGRDSFSRTPMD